MPESLTLPLELPARWTPMRYHPEQHRLWTSTARFATVTAGRRSGKTELAKRKLVLAACAECRWPNGRYLAGAPTREHAKDLYWDDLKQMVPPELIRSISEVELTIRLVTNTMIRVVGFDKPQRSEGNPIDGIILDEIADMRPMVFDLTVRPALAQRGGWCWFVGKPRGRNHYYQLTLRGNAPLFPDWDHFWWTAEDILPPEEIEALKRDLDPLAYEQEVRASFVTFTGRVYYCFKRELHAAEPLRYDPKLPLIFCFDFNVEPGVAAVLQEQQFRTPERPRKDRLDVADQITAAIGEVWIPRASNTPSVCRKLIADWGPKGQAHLGDVLCYGDASGGARSTKFEDGSDWTIIRDMLSRAFPGRVRLSVGLANPLERLRVNSVNARLLAADGKIRHLVDPQAVPHLIQDYEGVVTKEGTDGEILKEPGGVLTHMADSTGYYLNERFPASGPSITVEPIGGWRDRPQPVTLK